MHWIYGHPKLAQMVGQVLFSVGGLLVVCGLMGRVAMTAINSTRSLGNLPALSGLSEAYPTSALWWVPEHLLGYAVGAVVAVVGIYVALTAKAVRKSMNSGKTRYG